MSAIKSVLIDDGYPWEDNRILLTALTKACKLKNDCVTSRLPIQSKLLDMILFEVQRHFDTQPFLSCLYKSILAMGFHGLLRIGELTQGDHVVLAKNVYIALKKPKIMLVLYSSKTHSKANLPQKIKITAQRENDGIRNFCPFQLIRQYLKLRGTYQQENEQFFVFRDKQPVKPENARTVLKTCITKLGLDHKFYNFHSLRIGKATQMLKNNFSIEEIKRAGRWRSNAVYKYLKL